MCEGLGVVASKAHSFLFPSTTKGAIHAGTTAEAKWNADVRRGFVQKVLFIVFIQLLITTGICMAFFFVKPIKVCPSASCKLSE
jgi:hypothetical protein